MSWNLSPLSGSPRNNMLFSTLVTIHRRGVEADYRATWTDLTRYAYVDPAPKSVALTPEGARPIKQLLICFQPDGFHGVWSVAVGDEVTVQGVRRPVIEVNPIFTPRGMLHHVEVSVE